MSSSDKSESLFNPQSNALKNILKKPKEEKKTFGKQEFLARRKFFLQKLENDGGIPKPKSLINNSSTKKKTSNEKIKNAVTITKSINKTPSPQPVSTKPKTTNIEKISLPPSHEWSISSAKSESLKKIIDLAEKKDTNTVGKNVFNARQKFFADSQLNSVDQLMPRPCTPPGYVYFEKCPSPSLEPRRNSYSLYSSSPVLSPSLKPASPSLRPSSPYVKPASPIPSLPTLSSSPTPTTTTYLPWEHGNSKKKDVVTPPKQHTNSGIECLEKVPLVSEESIVLPEPVNFNKESIVIEEPAEIKIEKVEASEPMIPKLIKLLPKPVEVSTISLPNDEPILIQTTKVEEIKPQFPQLIVIPEKLPESVKFEKVPLPDDEPVELKTEFVKMSEVNIPKVIQILPEPVKISKEVLPQDEPLDIMTETVVAGEQQIPKPIEIEQPEERADMKSNIIKTMDISSLALESNIEEKKENKRNDDLLNKPLIDFGNDGNYSSNSSSDSIENTNENQPLLDLDHEIINNSNNDLLLGNFESQPLLDNTKQSLPEFNNDLLSSNFDSQPLIDFSNETTEVNNSNMTENPLISFDENPLLIDVKEESSTKKTNSIGSITELLMNNGTLSLDEPLPRKSIPPTPNSDMDENLIELSESEMSDKVKNWYSVVETAINKDENLDESLI